MTTAETKGGEPSGSIAGFIGSLAHTPLAEVFQRLVREGRSGDLQATTPTAIKTVYFDRGFVVFASSNLKSERLGESMIDEGRISRHEFALVSMVMKSTRRKFGETLVQAGIVSEEELGHYVATQVNRIVLSLFSAKSGMYSFDERPCSIPVDCMVSLSVYRILLEGVRGMTSQRLVLTGLPSLDTRLKVVSEPPFTLDAEKLRRVEKEVLRCAGSGASISEIVEIVGGNKGVALRAAYGLYSAGVLEAVATEAPNPRLRLQAETGTFVLSEIRRKLEARQEAPPVEPSLALEEPGTPPASPTRSVTDAVSDAREGPLAFLSRLREWIKKLWVSVENARLRWVGASAALSAAFRKAFKPHEPRKLSLEGESSPPTGRTTPRPDAVPRIATERTPTPARREVENLGAPVWSILSKPEEREGKSSKPEMEPKVGVPSWSMRDEASELEPQENRPTPRAVGVPSWSMKDDPWESLDRSPGVHIEPPRKRDPKPAIEKEVPPPRPAARPRISAERRETPLEEPPSLEPESALEGAMAFEPLSSLDSELFIEGDDEFPGDDESSMLSHIPVEEIALTEEALEIEIEIEVEGEAFAEIAESVEPAAPRAEEPAPPVIETRPYTAEAARREPSERRPHGSRPSEPPASSPAPVGGFESRGETDTDEPSRAEVAASRAEAMRRMRQGGGEARLLRDVKLHFKLQDWEGVVPLLEQLVQISPGSGLYRGMLARAMSRHPVMRKNAEEHFIEALRLAPHDAELHYWLGLYYKSFGLKSRAYTEFRSTLRIEPKHEGARKQLAGDRKDDAVGTVIKKIFG
jgi:hypothetical protein